VKLFYKFTSVKVIKCGQKKLQLYDILRFSKGRLDKNRPAI
jgi:hypothetical protein